MTKEWLGLTMNPIRLQKHMQTTGSPRKILGATEENEKLFINQGITIIETNSSNKDFPSQNPTAVTD